jgi:signal transduction histidine kinase
LRSKIEDVSDSSLRAELVRDIRRINLLVSAMLDLARLQNQAIEKHPIDLSAIAREVLADFSPSALNCGVDLSLEQDDAPIMVEGVEPAIRSALANLVGNALLHARGATRIVAKLRRETVSICDDGDLLHSNDDFHGDEASKLSHGLGLSIVREIMVAHGGSLTIAAAEGRGTTACLCFPKSQNRFAQDVYGLRKESLKAGLEDDASVAQLGGGASQLNSPL